jgi:YaiO family outer membrane protein
MTVTAPVPTRALIVALFLLAPPLAAQDAPRGWTVVELRAAVHGLTDGFASWNEQEARIDRRASARTGVGVAAARLWRFGAEDRRYAADGSMALGSRVTIGAEGETSPSHRIAARVGGRGWTHVSLGSGWGVQLAATERRYGDGVSARLRAASATVERYAGPWYVSYAYTAGRAIDETPTASQQGRVTRFWGRRSAITASVAAGTEAENLGWRGVQVMNVRGAALWGDIPLGAHVGLVYSGAWTQQGALYRRSTVSVGMRVRTD